MNPLAPQLVGALRALPYPHSGASERGYRSIVSRILPSLARSSSERPRTQSSQTICSGFFGCPFHILLPHWALEPAVVAFLFTAPRTRTRRSPVLSTSDIGFSPWGLQYRGAPQRAESTMARSALSAIAS